MTAPYDAAFVGALLAAYEALVSDMLIPLQVGAADAVAWLHLESELAVVAHDTQLDPQP